MAAKRISLLLRAALSAGLIVWLIARADMAGVGNALSRVSWGWFVAAVLLHVTGVFFTAWRWRILLSAQELPVPLFYLARSFLIASFFNYFLPSNIGGDIYRAYDIGAFTGKPEKSLGILLVERVTGLFTLILFAIVASPWAARMFGSFALALAPLALGVLFIIAGLLLFWDVFIRQAGRFFQLPLLSRVRDKVRTVHEAIVDFRQRKRAVGFAFFVGFLLQVNVIFHHVLIAKAVGIGISLGSFFFLIPLVSVLLLLPASINGIGLRENAFVLLLGSLGVAPETGVAFCALLFSAMLIFGIAGGLVYAFSRQRKLPNPEPA